MSDDIYAAVRGYSVELAEERRSAVRNARRMAAAAFVLAAAGIAAAVTAYIRPVAPPVVMMVDQALGVVTTLDAVPEQKLSWGKALDESYVRRYVQLRERFLDAITVDDFKTVTAMSTPKVQNEYLALFQGDDARQKALGDGQIDVSVRSIVVDDDGVARVWFSTVEKRGASVQPERRWMATLRYAYINAAMTPETRARNPLGFQVREYMLYNDTGGGL